MLDPTLSLCTQGARNSRVSARVVSQLRAMIASAELQPGDQLAPEPELAAKLRVSRPSLRTGIAYLATMGVLKIRHGSGTFVEADPPVIQLNPLSIGWLREPSQLWEARLVLETSLVVLAAERITSKQLIVLAEEIIEAL